MSDKTDFTALKPGMVVNGYLIERELGRGAMAVVYLTRQLDLDRAVALKVMSAEFAAKKDYVRRFFNEVRTAAALSHPNIVQAYDAGVAFNSTYYFAMEYVEGESMLRRIERQGPVPVAEALEYAREIASALDYGWQKKRFRHGDIKPENFMVQNDGHVKLADFGLAMVKGHEYQGNEVMLTPHYAAPELIRGQRGTDNCLTDIYAFGASLYHMLSGSTPFPGNDAREVMRCHLTEKLEPLRRRCPAVPVCLSDFVGELMEKDSRRRIQDWKMVLSGIEAVAEKIFPEDSVSLSSSSSAEASSTELKEAGTLRQKRRLTAQIYLDYHRRKNLKIWMQGLGPLLAFLMLLLVWGGWYYCCHAEKSSLSMSRSSGQQKSQSVVPEAAVSRLSEKMSVDIPEKKDSAVSGENQSPAKIFSRDAEAVQSGSAVYSRLKTGGIGKQFTIDRDLAEFNAGLARAAEEEEPKVYSGYILPDYSIPMPEDGEMLEGLYLTELQILLRLESAIPFGDLGAVEKLQSAAVKWQKNHPGLRGKPEGIIHYILNQMGPLLESYPAFLVRMEPILQQGRIRARGSRNVWYRVHRVQLDGVRLIQYFPQGKLQLPLKKWEDLQKEGILRSLLIYAYKRDQSSERVLRLFHYFLFHHEYSECRLLLREAPREYRSVLAGILNLYAINSKERRSLAQFQDILRICQLESRALLGHHLNVFQYQNTGIVKRNQKLVEYWLNACRMYVSGTGGAFLIGEAMRCSITDPEKAVNLLQRAEGIYPGSYPEAKMLKNVYAQIFRNRGEAARKTESGCPFHDFNAISNHFTRIASLTAAPGNSGNDFLKLFVRAEAGLDRKSFLAARFSGVEAPIWKQSWLFARAVYDICQMRNDYTDDFKNLFLQSPEKSEKAGYLMMEYLLLTHRNSLYTADYNLNLYDFLKKIHPEQRISSHHLRFWKLSLALKLECQQRKEVLNDLDEFFRIFAIARGKILPENQAVLNEMRCFQELLKKRPREGSAVLKMLLQKYPGASGEDLRLFLACCGKACLGSKADEEFWNWYNRTGRHIDLLGGNILYDFLLRRVGFELGKGNAAAAVQLTDRGFQSSAVHQWIYFARLHFLRGGLLALGRTTGALIDASSLLEQSAWAGEKERTLIHVDPEYRVEIHPVGVGNYLCFWEDWLKICLQMQKKTSRKLDFSTGKDTMKAEMVLMDGLRKFYEHGSTTRNVIWAKEY